MAILRYLAKEHGYYGTSPDDVYQIEWIVESILDYQNIKQEVSLFKPGPFAPEHLEAFEKALGGLLSKMDKLLVD